MDRVYYVYIMTNHTGTLYVGLTNDLHRRIFEHRENEGSQFTSRYRIRRLVHWEDFGDVRLAIEREKEIKAWRREKKVALIEKQNPGWKDLSDGWFDDMASENALIRDSSARSASE
jgi:putative endonuclease